MGISGVLRHPTVLIALDPIYGLKFLVSRSEGVSRARRRFPMRNRRRSALRGHGAFRLQAIRIAWSAIVFPALILNYAGQAGIVLEGAPTEGISSSSLCPPSLLIALVILATLATVIASQAIITGAFSMTRQAIQLGWLRAWRSSRPPARAMAKSMSAALIGY